MSQETTMAKHSTLGEFMYQRQCVLSYKPVALTTLPSGQIRQDSMLHMNEEVDNVESADEFDPSSDQEAEGGEADRGNLQLFQGEIRSSATFLFGARSRFGRVVGFNNRFLSWKREDIKQQGHSVAHEVGAYLWSPQYEPQGRLRVCVYFRLLDRKVLFWKVTTGTEFVGTYLYPRWK